jgi:uncharacterized membrane protein YphA (DoxX/SURF4 family)
MKKNTILLILRITVALILLQTLYFKFTAHPESVILFSKLGMEPWGRIMVGIQELLASILILIPATVGFGAILTVGLMAGAIFFHLTILGIESFMDGGYLFSLAIFVFICSSVLTWFYKQQIISLFDKLTKSKK